MVGSGRGGDVGREGHGAGGGCRATARDWERREGRRRKGGVGGEEGEEGGVGKGERFSP